MRPAPILLLWIVLTFAAQALPWLGGHRPLALARGIEQGAARVEFQELGEVGDDVIRKAIQTQRATGPFWNAVSLLGELAFEPISLVVRALAVAALFSGLAALRGRPTLFPRTLSDCALAQGWWVLGAIVRSALMLALRRTDVETSPTLLLPPGDYPALLWVALRQADVFAVMGWIDLALRADRRGQVGWPLALLALLPFAASEAALRVAGSLVVEAGTRLSILPAG